LKKLVVLVHNVKLRSKNKLADKREPGKLGITKFTVQPEGKNERINLQLIRTWWHNLCDIQIGWAYRLKNY